MPEEFDPAWEYYTPDPEIAELLPPSGNALHCFLEAMRDDSGTPTGIRFGRGNPDRYHATRLAPLRPERPAPPPRLCPTCGWSFEGRNRYCSRACRPRQVGAPRHSVPRPAHLRRLRPARLITCRTCRGRTPYDRRTWPYCSQECRAVYRQARLATCIERRDQCREHRRRQQALARQQRLRPCLYCGELFPSRNGKRYCSRDCSGLAHRSLPARTCPTCGKSFQPDRDSRRYCSNACRPHPGKPRTLQDRPCEYCRISFRPLIATRRYCSVTCRNAAQQGKSLEKRKPVSRVDLDDLAARYTRGESLSQIATALGITPKHVARLRRRLDLPARPSGRPKSC